MLAKLLSLLLHAKSGAISGVLLLGATGALVSVSASNGVTTITITEASPSPSSSALVVRHETEKTNEPTPTPSTSPQVSSNQSSTTACTDERAALATQVQRVNTAFATFHTDLMKLRGLRAQSTLETADDTLKAVRQAAVKAIHATATQCVKNDDDEDEDHDNDEDKDEDNDNDDDDSVIGTASFMTISFVTGQSDVDENDGDHGRGKDGVAPVTFTGTDAAAIADQAIALMQAAFNTANTAPVTTPKPSHSPDFKSNDSNQKFDDKGGSGHDGRGGSGHRD
ncbi:MAG: hypothetical protein QOH08_2328 [Chloroflexota bacterium]|nr:hypothetical protein [Chloroflexota bacterium]